MAKHQNKAQAAKAAPLPTAAKPKTERRIPDPAFNSIKTVQDLDRYAVTKDFSDSCKEMKALLKMRFTG